jgi:hypothetical protein
MVQAAHAELVVATLEQLALALRACPGIAPSATVFRFIALWFEHHKVPGVNRVVQRLVAPRPTMYDDMGLAGIGSMSKTRVAVAGHAPATPTRTPCQGAGAAAEAGTPDRHNGDTFPLLVPSHHFVPLVYQIASRIGDDNGPGCTPTAGSGSGDATAGHSENDSSLGQVVGDLLFRLVLEHPLHTLPQLYALVNSNFVPSDQADSQFAVAGNSGKTKQAEELLERLSRFIDAGSAKGSSRLARLGRILKNQGVLSKALTALAYIDTSKFVKVPELAFAVFPTFTKYMRKLDLTQCFVPTTTIRLQPDGQYWSDAPASVASHGINSVGHPSATVPGAGDVVWVDEQGFGHMFKLTETGVNRPKIVKCAGVDGRKYKMLVKGKDDLRQDAVMEQLFEIVNDLLLNDTEATRRRLKLRTYKVCEAVLHFFFFT